MNAIMAMSTLNGYFGDILKATDVATIGMGIGMEALAERFTYADEFDQYEDRIITKKGMNQKSWMYLAGMINAMVTELKDLGSIMDESFKNKAAPIISTIQDSFSLGYSVWLWQGTRQQDPPDHNT